MFPSFNRLTTIAPSLAGLPVLSSASALAAVPSAEEIRRKAAEVVARPEFVLEQTSDRESLSVAFRILMWILKPLQWLFEAMDGIPDLIRWPVVIVLVLLVLGLCGHIVWTFVGAVRGPSSRKVRRPSPERLASPEELEKEADARAKEDDLIGAIRCLFRACLLRLEQAEAKPFRRGVTNREVLRRYRSSPLFEPLSRMVEIIDTRWYGYDPCLESDYLACRSEHALVRSLVERRAHAARP